MKIYSLPPSEGHRQVIALQCDYCGNTETGEDLPENWLAKHEEHFCPNCQDLCVGCFEMFSLKYSKEYFKQSFCENCQEKYLPQGD